MKRSIAIILLCTSCIQRYEPPPIKTPTAPSFKSPEPLATSTVACPEPEKVLPKATLRPWWKIFNDPILNDLETQSINNSPTVQAALARLEQAYATYGIALSSLFPEITLDVNAQRERISTTQTFPGSTSSTSSASPGGGSLIAKGPANAYPTPTPGPISAPVPLSNPCVVCPPTPMPVTAAPKPTTKPNPIITSLSILPTLTYELDFWGKNWQTTQSAKEQIKAEEEDLQTVLLMLTSSLADTYLMVRTYDAEIAILEQTAKTRAKSFSLNSQQYEAGLINKVPVVEAKTDQESVLASLEETIRLRALSEHALAELVGVPAAIFSLEPMKDPTSTLPTLPTIPPGVPSEMLKRRPDIRQQENLIAAAQYNVGVAKTAYFPDFTITLDYGFTSSRANQLFKWKSRTWLAAIDATTPIFTAGRIASEIEQAIAQYKQQVASYISTILVAFQDVEDSIYSVEQVKKELYHLDLEVKAATEAYKLVDLRYRMGLENYIIVVDDERTMLDAQRTEIQIQRAQYSNTVSLVRSLGGGWE